MAVKPWEERVYKPSDSVTQAQQAMQQHQQTRPQDYQSQYKTQMENLLSQYQNRGQFNYDVNADAMYQQMLDRYIQQGRQGMMDTMGKAAALTGGYGNSYAQTAGQQTYQGYLQGAYDQMPQYYQMALDRYNQQGNDLLQQYNLLGQQEAMEYDRYNDSLNRYFAEQDRLRSAYESERAYDYGVYEADRAFDYGKYQDEQNFQYRTDRDAVADDQWNQQWQYQQERDAVSDSRYEAELARAQVDWMLANGKDIPEELAKLSGYSQAYIDAAKAQPYSGGVGGNGGNGKTKLSVATYAAEYAKVYGLGAAKTELNKKLISGQITAAEFNAASDNLKAMKDNEALKKHYGG